MVNRRDFLRLMGVAGATGAWRELHAILPGRPVLPVGIQLYTVRTLLAKDFEGTIGVLAQLGYRELEFAGYFDRTPAQVTAVLRANGLTAPSAHVDFFGGRDAMRRTLDTAAELGHKWVVMPWLEPARRTADGYRRAADLLLEASGPAAERGIRVGYHNHDFEFAPVEGTDGLSILMHACGDRVDFELDCYWTAFSGRDPVAFLRQHPGRVRLLHLKDSRGAPKHEMVSVGDGVIPWRPLLEAAMAVGVRHRFVEHDNPADPIESVRASYAFLSRLSA